MNRAVFLDRDNTIIVNDGDLGDPAHVTLIKGAANAIASLRGLGFRIIVVSNQGGVARGVFSEHDVDRVNQRVNELVHQTAGARIDRFYYCPYHPQGSVERYRSEHPWRKPQPGMLLQAAADFDIDVSRSWMVGDQLRDVQAGAAAGVRTILLKPNAEGEDTDPGDDDKPAEYIARNLPEAARIIAQAPPRDEAGDPSAPALTARLTPRAARNSDAAATRQRNADDDRQPRAGRGRSTIQSRASTRHDAPGDDPSASEGQPSAVAVASAIRPKAEPSPKTQADPDARDDENADVPADEQVGSSIRTGPVKRGFQRRKEARRKTRDADKTDAAPTTTTDADANASSDAAPDAPSSSADVAAAARTESRARKPITFRAEPEAPSTPGTTSSPEDDSTPEDTTDAPAEASAHNDAPPVKDASEKPSRKDADAAVDQQADEDHTADEHADEQHQPTATAGAQLPLTELAAMVAEDEARQTAAAFASPVPGRVDAPAHEAQPDAPHADHEHGSSDASDRAPKSARARDQRDSDHPRHEPTQAESSSTPTTPGRVIPAEHTLREILQELRNQRVVHAEFSYLDTAAVALQMLAGLCLVAALLFGRGGEDMLFFRWIAAGLLMQLTVIAVLLFRR